MTINHSVGDRVSVDSSKYPGVWVITKLDPANAVLQAENGTRTLRAPYSLLLQPGASSAVVYYDAGMLVRIPDGKHAGLWVVLKDDGGDRVNLARLGGDGGKYLRAGRRGLVKVDPSEVLK